MLFLAIGRSEVIVDAIIQLTNKGHELAGIVTSRPAPEYVDSLKQLEIIASQKNVNLLHSRSNKEVEDFIRGLPQRPRVAVSYNHTAILNAAVIDLFELGVLNAHGGDLPRYRGNACQAWAIINGENKIGLCVHKMLENDLDSGPILVRNYMEITKNTYVGDCLDWIRAMAPEMFADALEILDKDSTFVLEDQQTSLQDPLRCYPRNASDGRVNWDQEAQQVDRLIRASSRPFSGAFSYFNGEKINFFRSNLVESKNYLAIPGQILSIDDHSVDVASKNGTIRISDFAIDGKAVKVPNIFTSLRGRFTNLPESL
jgi:UDP-4-amino-4-deoxy-L-arabinose formyltransferase/UDP-glucuronic acid dehydrogenase (UDP-4-keto-hexauronic acid decarboxylating)